MRRTLRQQWRVSHKPDSIRPIHEKRCCCQDHVGVIRSETTRQPVLVQTRRAALCFTLNLGLKDRAAPLSLALFECLCSMLGVRLCEYVGHQREVHELGLEPGARSQRGRRAPRRSPVARASSISPERAAVAELRIASRLAAAVRITSLRTALPIFLAALVGQLLHSQYAPRRSTRHLNLSTLSWIQKQQQTCRGQRQAMHGQHERIHPPMKKQSKQQNTTGAAFRVFVFLFTFVF